MIHQYQLHGNNIVLDIESGAVHLLDELSYKILERLDPESMEAQCPAHILEELSSTYAEQEILEAYEELNALYRDGLIFSGGSYEKYSGMAVHSPVKAMCLHVAHDCNLRCKYCFASTGDFEGTRCLMSAETGKQAIDFLLKNSGKRRNLELDFFGGEPLMNFRVVKEVVAYAREREKTYGKNFRFTITTNGVLLNEENRDFINREMSNVVLSLDGRKEVNDNMRETVGGGSSYDIIVPKFQQLVKERGSKQYYVRGTFTHDNLDFSRDVFHLNELGFQEVSVEPVVGDEENAYSIKDSDIPRICEEYEYLAKELLEREEKGKSFNFFHFLIDLDGGPCAIKRLRGCGCGNEYVAITPEGDIYPCHQFVGMEEWRMGSLGDGSFDLEMKKEFAKTNIYTKEECRNCWARYYCSGGCNANSVQYCGNMNKPYEISCILEKKRLECAIMMQVERAKRKLS